MKHVTLRVLLQVPTPLVRLRITYFELKEKIYFVRYQPR